MSFTHIPKTVLIAGIALSGLLLGAVRNAEAAGSAAREPVAQQLTPKEVRKLAATARSPEDYLKLACYYTAEADRLDAQAAQYAEAAATYSKGPRVKNLISPTAVAFYEQSAEALRGEARHNRELAASYEQKARN